MAPWKGLRGPGLAAWVLGAVFVIVAAVLFLVDYDRFRWPPVIPGLAMAGASLNFVAALSRREGPSRD